jgi:RNA polymerase sigma factor (sigma-70 family)
MPEMLYLSYDYQILKRLFNIKSDSVIIEGIRNQDENILNWLYDSYFSSVKKYVLQNNGSIDDVSDVFQDSIIILYKQIIEDNLVLNTDLKGYFYGVARNVWNAQLRRKQRNTSFDFDVIEDSDNDEENNLLLEQIISKAYRKLKPDQQMVLDLFSEGLSYEEIARKMGLKNEEYARRKKYLCKELLMDIVKEDPEYQEYLRYLT